MIAVFGGGEIADKGIRVAGLSISKATCDVTDRRLVDCAMTLLLPECVIFTVGVSRPMEVADDRAGYFDEIETNLVGAFNVARAAAQCSVGTLIFIASLAGLYGKPNHAGYSASKAGLISLVQSLAMEGHNAYAISPGRVQTAMRERDYPGEDPRTRLDPRRIGEIVRDVLDGKYTPGDNIVIRMRGHEVLPIEIHRGDGWRERLKVGEAPTC